MNDSAQKLSESLKKYESKEGDKCIPVEISQSAYNHLNFDCILLKKKPKHLLLLLQKFGHIIFVKNYIDNIEKL